MRHRSPKILLLEPDQLLAQQCMQALTNTGREVTWCRNAQDAINAADKLNPDIVVLELLLTAHSGIEFLYEFRSYNEWRRTPVILFSRLPRAELPVSDQVLDELGVSLFLYKSETSLARLGERIDSLLARSPHETTR